MKLFACHTTKIMPHHTILLLTTPTILGSGIHVALSAQKDWDVQVATPHDFEALRHLSTQVSPHITIIDDIKAFEVFTHLGWANLFRFGRLVILLTHPLQEDHFYEYTKWGVAAFIRASYTPDEVFAVVRKTLAYIPQLTEELLDPSSQHMHSPSSSKNGEQDELSSDRPQEITAREKQILRLIAQGNSNKLIARALSISDQTVKNHITSILKKLNVSDRTGAVVVALQNRWIAFPGEDSFLPPQVLGTHYAA